MVGRVETTAVIFGAVAFRLGAGSALALASAVALAVGGTSAEAVLLALLGPAAADGAALAGEVALPPLGRSAGDDATKR